jgi:hypothetical protein
MAKAKLSGASELSNFKFDTSTYITLSPLASLKNNPTPNTPKPSTPPKPGGKAKG